MAFIQETQPSNRDPVPLSASTLAGPRPGALGGARAGRADERQGWRLRRHRGATAKPPLTLTSPPGKRLSKRFRASPDRVRSRLPLPYFKRRTPGPPLASADRNTTPSASRAAWIRSSVPVCIPPLFASNRWIVESATPARSPNARTLIPSAALAIRIWAGNIIFREILRLLTNFR